jgi:hypothetical protein
MDTLKLAHRTVGVVRFAVGLEGAKNTTFGVLRGAAQGTLRTEPPIIRMVLGALDGASRARQAHQATRGVQVLNAVHDALGHARGLH